MPLAGRMKLRHFLVLVGGVVAVGTMLLVARHEPPAPTVPEIAVVAPPSVPSTPAATPSPPAAPATPTVSVADQAQSVVLSYRGRDLGTDKLKDVSKGRAFKVNVYQDDGHATANRAKVDLDRDDQWDQKYTFQDDGSVALKTSSDDDETYDVEETFTP